MKPANASAMRSTSDAVSVHRHIRSPDELTLSLRPSQSRMSWRPIGSACDPDVKRRGRAGRSASGLAKVVPRAAATTVGGKFGWERSGQGDFVKVILPGKGWRSGSAQLPTAASSRPALLLSYRPITRNNLPHNLKQDWS